MKTLRICQKETIWRIHALLRLKDRSYIDWLRQVHCRPGGCLHVVKEEVLRLDRKKKKATKFCPPRWPPVISIMERERRKRAKREFE
ncbi:hypothetical protein MHYP_G00192440 [Metynnis hypsauchen]